MLPSLRLARPLSVSPLRAASQVRYFHPTSIKMVKAGDKIPDVELHESSPGDKVNLSKTLTGKGLIIGVPAAFSEYRLSLLPLWKLQCFGMTVIFAYFEF